MKKFGMPKVYGVVTVGERGQVVIPAQIRKAFNIKPGERLIIFAKEQGPIMLIGSREFDKFLDQAGQMIAKIKRGKL